MSGRQSKGVEEKPTKDNFATVENADELVPRRFVLINLE